jgi:hypothetical protein
MKRDQALLAMAALVEKGYSTQINARVMSPEHRLPHHNADWDEAGQFQVVYDVLVFGSSSRGLGIRSIDMRELCDIAEEIGLTATLYYLDGSKIRFETPRREIP